MDMVPVFESEGAMLELSEHGQTMANVETVAIERRKLSHEIHVVGKVQYNETGLAEVVTRVDGFVERLFVDYTGVAVQPGDHLVELYSPDLVLAQQEMLIAMKGVGGSSMVASTTRKLLRLGVTQRQVDELVRSRKIQEWMTLYSPIKGTVTEKLVVQKSAVKSGDVLYRLANLESVWVSLDIYEYELPWIQHGQKAKVKSEAYPGESFTGRVWFISPVLDDKTRTITVLLTIDNTGLKLKPGMFVSGIIHAELGADGRPSASDAAGMWSCPMHPFVLQSNSGRCPVCQMVLVQTPGQTAGEQPESDQKLLAVPVTAVLDSGMRKLVYVEKGKGRFVPVEIVTGPRADAFYPVLTGLSEGDRVAMRGNFLLDSQQQIRGMPSLFSKEGQPGGTGHVHDSPTDPSKERRSPVDSSNDSKVQDRHQHLSLPKE